MPSGNPGGESPVALGDSPRAAARRTPIAVIRGGGGHPLFCLHPVGGDVHCYLRLRELVPGRRPIFAIESRGLVAPEREHVSLAAMAADYATLVQHAAPEEPYELCGWSMGACVAHATARELERRGATVATVVMIDPPSLTSAPSDERSTVSLLLAGILASVGRSIDAVVSDATCITMSCLDPTPAALYDASVQRGALSASAVSCESFARSWRLRCRHLELLASYTPSPIDATVHVWWAQQGPRRTLDTRLARRAVREGVAGGDHFSIMQPQHLQRIFAAWAEPESIARYQCGT
jgi:myxalamid-type polyketide synthase MxaB